MFDFFKKKGDELIFSSICQGRVINMSEVEDEMFSNEILGKGIAFKPSNGDIFSPVDGEVSLLFDTKHAIGLTTDDGSEILIHMGIDTVELNGQGFEILVDKGQEVKKGDPLAKIDLAYLVENDKKTDIPIVITNSDEFEKFQVLKEGEVSVGDEVFKAIKK